MNNSNDPFRNKIENFDGYRKVFVEPIPPLFEQLKKNLVHLPDTTFVNAAVVAETGKNVGGERSDWQESNTGLRRNHSLFAGQDYKALVWGAQEKVRR